MTSHAMKARGFHPHTMTTFSDPPTQAVELLNEVLNEYEDHKPLVDAGVTIALRFATAAEKKDGSIDFPLKHHGFRAYAIAKVRSYQDRTEGLSDAKIDIDSGWWMEAEREERKALLDHECLHFEVCFNDDGGVETDDFNRPKLKTRKHDFQFGWFRTIAKRHGKSSIECQQMARMLEDAGQYLLPGMYDPESKLLVPSAASLLAAIDAHNVKPVAPTEAQHESSIQENTTVTISADGHKPVVMSGVDFSRAAKAISAKARHIA